jgi:pimeloyl-ACP methyl ester carboxylesterase
LTSRRKNVTGMALPPPDTQPALAIHASVTGTELTQVELGDGARRSFRAIAWADLARTPLAPGPYVVRFQVAGGERVALELPVCAGRTRVLVDGTVFPAPPGPVVLPLPSRPAEAHEIELELQVGGYEKRIACGAAPRFGAQIQTREGLSQLSFHSPWTAAGGGRAVVFVPRGHDPKKPGALLVGTHPWNGSPWTYAAYAELLQRATAKDVVLLFPSGLGNSLYTASAEDETMRALDAVAQVVAVDPRRVSIWGASLGGAGATTIGLHHPDRFATITSFFGDARYDMTTYVRSILKDDAGAHQVNAIDVVDNARHVPIWLVHGEDDRVSPIAQSVILARALEEKKHTVRFDRVPHAGHEGTLVVRFVSEVVDRAAEARVPENPRRVTFKSVRREDTSAYGAHLVRSAAPGDGFVDIDRRADSVHVLKASGVTRIELTRGALGGGAEALPIVIDDPAAALAKVEVRWIVPPAPTSVAAPSTTPASSAPPAPSSTPPP